MSQKSCGKCKGFTISLTFLLSLSVLIEKWGNKLGSGRSSTGGSGWSKQPELYLEINQMPELVLEFGLDLVFWVMCCQADKGTPSSLVTMRSPEPGGTMLSLGMLCAQVAAMKWVWEICSLAWMRDTLFAFVS